MGLGGSSAAWPAATRTLCLALGWPGPEKALYGPMRPALRDFSRRQSLCCPLPISLPSFLFQPCFLTRPRPGIRFYSGEAARGVFHLPSPWSPRKCWRLATGLVGRDTGPGSLRFVQVLFPPSSTPEPDLSACARDLHLQSRQARWLETGVCT